MGKILAVCTSEKKGTVKTPVDSITVEKDYGVSGDAHADSQTHRQVSLLAVESIDKMRSRGFEINFGDFAENITVEGIDLISLPVGTRLLAGDEVVLEMSQIGKECHAACAIRQQVGDCVMPREGIFVRVIHGGTLKPGDTITTA
jgi:MOSC domain-containing protein YiiM